VDRVLAADVPEILGVSAPYLRQLARAAPDLYERRAYHDGEDRRELTVPSDALKEIQTRIYAQLLRPIGVNEAVHSAPGRSILTNARRHAGHSHLSTFDIRNCFPSVRPDRVRAGLERLGFNPGVAKLVTRLTTIGHQLPQGAPTSPALLSAVLVDFDGKLASMARRRGLTYTRYVDDLCLSGGARTENLARVVEDVFRRHRFRLHPRKRFDWGPDERHVVTKIMVNTTPSALPEYRESLEAILRNHRSGKTVLTVEDLESVRGKIGFVTSVNAEDGARLERLLAADAAIPALAAGR